MQQINCYRDGNRWVITVEDTEKDISDVISGIMSQFITRTSAMPAVSFETNRESADTSKTDTEPVSEDGAAEGEEAVVCDPEDMAAASPDDPYAKAVKMLRDHRNSKVLLDKLNRLFDTTDVDEVIKTRSKEEILSLFH